MSEPSLHELERDVEAARARLASDLATLRSPSTFSEFTEGLKSEALDTKDALVEKAKSSVQSSVQGVVDELKAKALANPAAVLAIGAGLAWRLVKHPPVATVLVGAGLYSLLRTPQGAPESPYVTRATEMAGTLRDRASEYGEQAGELAATARERAQQWSAAAQDAAADIRERAASAAQQVSQTVGSMRDSIVGDDQARLPFEDRREYAARMAGSTSVLGESARATTAMNTRFDEPRGTTDGAMEQASRLWSEAQRNASDTASGMAHAANRAMHDARDAASGAARHASRVTQDLAARAGATLNDASSSVQRSLRDDDTRNTLLLGAAGLAVAAAIGIAMQRRSDDED
jgi:hypothetical protein